MLLYKIIIIILPPCNENKLLLVSLLPTTLPPVSLLM